MVTEDVHANMHIYTINVTYELTLRLYRSLTGEIMPPTTLYRPVLCRLSRAISANRNHTNVEMTCSVLHYTRS